MTMRVWHAFPSHGNLAQIQGLTVTPKPCPHLSLPWPYAHAIMTRGQSGPGHSCLSARASSILVALCHSGQGGKLETATH